MFNFLQFLINDVISKCKENLSKFPIVVVRVYLIVELVFDHAGSHTVLPDCKGAQYLQLGMLILYDGTHYLLPLLLDPPNIDPMEHSPLEIMLVHLFQLIPVNLAFH